MNKKEIMYNNIKRHGEVLNQMFETGIDPIALCKKLRRIEVEANRKATEYCNGDIETDKWEEVSDSLLAKVEQILNFKVKDVPVFINSDPRGYALKIRESYTKGYNEKAENRLYVDWGGYGILAPDFSD